MTDQELRKLSRNDLLELLIDQAKEIDRLREELNAANQKLNDRKIAIDKAGSIAEAALQLNGVFTAAQEACAQYMVNITDIYQQQAALRSKMERETQEKCNRMIREARKLADEYWEFTRKKVQALQEPTSNPANRSMGYSKSARKQR